MVVAVNRFKDDTEAEIDLVRRLVDRGGRRRCSNSNNWAEGGAGAVELAKAVVRLARSPANSTSSIRST